MANNTVIDSLKTSNATVTSCFFNVSNSEENDHWNSYLKEAHSGWDAITSTNKPPHLSAANPQCMSKESQHPVKTGLEVCARRQGTFVPMKADSLVYADKPQTLDHLERQHLAVVIADIRPQMLENVIENWASRLDYIRASCGSRHMPEIIFKMTATAGLDVVQSGRPIFDDFFQHLWPYIGNNTANVVFQMVKRLWLIRIDQ
ncbi:hypothetical protein TNCV_3185261 [Trichonephila clavipes]|nr:hypothetical protein TNCV_3185261 [Trichonephila clavipes]